MVKILDKILLIDGMNAIFRANISFGPPTKHQQISETNCSCKSLWNTNNNACYGDQYSVVYNFFRNLRPIVEMFQPAKIFFGLEGSSQFRYDLFPDYKANRIIKEGSKREAMDKFHVAKRKIIELLKYFPVTIARAAKYECDDLIGAFCENLKEEDLTVLTNDSDYIQLLQRDYKHIKIYNPIKKVYMEAPKYPYVAYKSLTGDKSDNIPKLLSEKKAESLMNDPEKFKSFMDVEENRANFQMNRQLVQFADLKDEEISLVDGEKDFDKIRILFDEMKFQSITNDKSWEKFTRTFDCVEF